MRPGGGQGDHGRQVQFLDDLQGDQRLTQIVVGLRDDEIDALVHRPRQLLFIHRADHARRRLFVLGVVRPGVADVAGDQRITLAGDLVGDAHRLAVHGLQIVLATDILQLAAVRVIGERDHDVGPRTKKLAVKLAECIGKIEHDFGHIGTGLDVAAALEFEDVALSAKHNTGLQPVEDAAGAPSRHG